MPFQEGRVCRCQPEQCPADTGLVLPPMRTSPSPTPTSPWNPSSRSTPNPPPASPTAAFGWGTPPLPPVPPPAFWIVWAHSSTVPPGALEFRGGRGGDPIIARDPWSDRTTLANMWCPVNSGVFFMRASAWSRHVLGPGCPLGRMGPVPPPPGFQPALPTRPIGPPSLGVVKARPGGSSSPRWPR